MTPAQRAARGQLSYAQAADTAVLWGTVHNSTQEQPWLV